MPTRRPRDGAPHTTAGRTGFNSSDERFAAGNRRSDVDSVMAFLVGGELGPVGRPEHAQRAILRANGGTGR